MNYHKKANITLAVVLIGFLGSALLARNCPGILGLQLLKFVLEAALVGGLADWFAITAIFKKPLGWGFHTALIPRNRAKLIEAVAGMVQSELLTLDLLRRKISDFDFADRIIQTAERLGGADFLADKLTRLLRDYAGKQDPAGLAANLSRSLRSKALDWRLVPNVERFGSWALRQGYLDQALDRLADGLWDKASEGSTRLAILNYLETVKEEKLSSGGAIFRTLLGFVEMSDGLNMEEAADALQVEILLTLRKLNDPDDLLRRTLREILLRTMDNLAKEPEFQAQLEAWKDEILQAELLDEFLTKAAGIVLKAADSELFSLLMRSCVQDFWRELRENRDWQGRINEIVTSGLCQVVLSRHHEIGSLVRETMETYSDEDLNRFVEEKAGNDLQWIRINGSMIGGIVGFFLFLLLNFVYDPYLLPVLTHWKNLFFG